MIIDKAMQYCRDALRNVSRSFALTIPMLEKNILIPILVGYLEARILDSFEDEKKCEIGNKKRVENMEKVISIISDPDSLDKGMIKELGDAASELMQNPHYLDLTLNMDKVMAVHRTIDRNSSNAISRWFSIMSAGMQKYLNKRIDTFEQLDEYCYYVGGTVGGFLTEVLLDKTRMASTEQVRILKAEQRDFGLFLQKVNIIRDFREDMLRNEKIFWPHEVFMEHNLKPRDMLERENEPKAMLILDRMIGNVKRHIKSTRNYIDAIPEDYPGFRKMSAINFTMGFETLVKLNGNPDVFYSESPVKIDREVRDSILSDPILYMENMSGSI